MEAKKNPTHDLQRQSFKFFLIGLSISATLIITAFEWRTKKSEPIVSTFDLPIEAMLEVKPTVHEIIPPPPVQIKKSSYVTKPDVAISFAETKDTTTKPDYTLPDSDVEFIQVQTLIPEEADSCIFTAPELMPMPVGGYPSFYQHLSNTLKYPRQAQRNQTQGKVFVEFIIDQNGQVTNLKVVKGIGDGCDEEALRVLSKIRWQPGKQRGIPVKVRMTLPLTFKLN